MEKIWAFSRAAIDTRRRSRFNPIRILYGNKIMKFHQRLLLGAAMLACSAVAQAQWVWLDGKGIRQYSDQPPPTSVPAARILKAPKGAMPDLRKEIAEQPADETQRPAIKPGATLAEREADSAKRRTEAAAQARKAQSDAKTKADNAAACENTRSNQHMLESGVRIATADKDGERTFLDDAQKAEQMRRNRDTLATHCQ
jgi:type IV secretory pathway VirB10-like protein